MVSNIFMYIKELLTNFAMWGTKWNFIDHACEPGNMILDEKLIRYMTP